MNIYKEMSDNRKSREQKGKKLTQLTHIFDGLPMYQCKQLCAHCSVIYIYIP